MTRTRAALAAGFSCIVFAAALSSARADAVWPTTVNVNGYTFTWYEPQATAWQDHTKLSGMMAVSITPPGKTAVYGVVDLTADTVADVEGGTVVVSNIQVASTKFPTLSADQQQKLDQYIRTRAQDLGSRVLPLNTIVLSLQSSEKSAARQVNINTTPPQLFYSEKPAILVAFDGAPVFGPIKGLTGDLTFAVNTNWNVFKTGSTYYLLNGSYWLQAPALNGPWKGAGALPAVFGQLPDDDNWKQVRAQLSAGPVAAAQVPTVWIANGQAEAIVTDGAPKAVAIAGTSLSYIDNTDAALFYDRANKQYYYLTSGRWFATGDPSTGPWTFASKSLPGDFAKIPADSARGWVLANVPGTAQAAAAVGAANVPREASVSRTAATLSVTYGGEPQFKPIPGTTLEYAVNTSFDVLKLNDTYYACSDGVWFTSGSATGPWTVADSVPQDVYTIPSDQPLYNDTYVNVVSSDANTVTYGYSAGYMYSYPWYGGLYYGTGFWFPPYVGWYGGYPAYYPWPRTYVGGAYYNSATGAYARGYGVYGPYGGAHVTAGYSAATGTYWRGGSVYGPYGGVGHGTIYNPATGNYYHGAAAWGPGGAVYRGSGGNVGAVPYGSRYGATTSSNAYKNWGSAATMRTASTTQFKPGYGGNVYAGKDGNVYRPTSTGGWQQYNNANGAWKTPSGGGWNSVSAKGSGFNNTAASQQYRGFTNTAGGGGWNGGGGGPRPRASSTGIAMRGRPDTAAADSVALVVAAAVSAAGKRRYRLYEILRSARRGCRRAARPRAIVGATVSHAAGRDRPCGERVACRAEPLCHPYR